MQNRKSGANEVNKGEISIRDACFTTLKDR